MSERDYVLGTHDEEIERLGLQHRVWRPSVLDLWRLAGVTEGQTVIDAGAGPGYCAIDFAEIVGPRGKVIAAERSRRFQRTLHAAAEVRGLSNIEQIETDLLEWEWPEGVADIVWCRWVLAFVTDPTTLVANMVRALRPGGALVVHEYYDYRSWRLAPHSVEFETYVAAIIAHWRMSGGEPDIGLDVARLCAANGLAIERARPVAHAAHPHDFVWRWPAAFARAHAQVMVAAGAVAPDTPTRIDSLLARYEADPNTLSLTPGVLQIVARKAA